MIHILTTDGITGGLNYLDEEGNIESNFSVEDFLKSVNVSFQYSVENVLNKVSRFITDVDPKLLVKRIKGACANNIVLTHGTFTMEETAKYIGKLNLNKTRDLVGSFVLGSSADRNAPLNLGYAICSLQFLKPDVYVAMNGTIAIGTLIIVLTANF